MRVDSAIFKSYDVRGIYPDQIDERTAYALGRAFASLLRVDCAVVGRDMRPSAPAIFEAVAAGLTTQGADVIDIGMVSTDQYYFACATLGKAGMMVTASHNPPEYIGFKMVRRMPYLLSSDEGIQDLRLIVESGDFSRPANRGQIHQYDLSQQFTTTVLGLTEGQSLAPLKVVADTGNGMVGPSLQRVYQELPVELIGMFLEPDGTLPNHGLDPMQEENRVDLQKRVIREHADVGFAFDGDGDRFFVIDDRGHFVPGDFITALMGCYLLEKHPRDKIIYDVRSSWAVRDLVSASGGIPLMERVGHSFLKPRLAREGGVFAGELSGHYYFRDFYGADSGLVPSLVLLEMLSREDRKLSELLAPIESNYFISGEINSAIENPHHRIETLASRYSDGQIDFLDGISVSYPDWHFNVRTSNTEPLLRLNLEALDRSKMEEKRDELLAHIRN